MRPITLRNPNLNKGPSSSDEFNKLRNDIQTDITSLFDIVNEHDDKITENMDHVLREHYFLQNRLRKLEGRVRELEHDYQNNLSGESILTRSFYHASNIIPSSPKNPINLDTIHGIVSPVIVKSHDKIAYRNDLGQFILPNNLEVTVYESTDVEPIDEETGQRQYYTVDTNGIKKAFDGDKNSFWVRQSEMNENKCVTEVYANIHVKIPQEISNNVYSNTILLHPSPEYAMSIMDIQYRNQNGEWRRVETFPVQNQGSGEVPVEITEAGKLMFSFPKRQVTELQIKVKQPYWFKHDNKRMFLYGFQDIVVEYREYSQDSAEFVTRFSLEGTDRRFSSVGIPKITVPVGCPPFNDYTVKYELYFDEGLTEQFDFATDIFQPVQTVYVKTIMKTAGDQVPILREIELPYRHETIEL
ncbi:hypothetical protein [Cytobacillus oceanisediminis]|uniref:hypothetical protein n=1 Tax=Cytobacillus oceanisediminis TaxID=665099 RepID=UPI001FB410AF|nr:hypothetical protein [Cytobacillus oceanisediminis]UOE58050.1 hypothetical protein IRB79_27690 [Cytobacillus oceanisediminis]